MVKIGQKYRTLYVKTWVRFVTASNTKSPLSVKRYQTVLVAAESCKYKTSVSGNKEREFFVFVFWHNSPQWAMASSFPRFLDHTQRRTTVGRTPLDKWSARHRDLYLITHNTHRQTSTPPVGFEPTISAGERP